MGKNTKAVEELTLKVNALINNMDEILSTYAAPQSIKENLTIEDVELIYSIPKGTIYQRIHKRVMPHYKNGKRLLFKRNEMEDYFFNASTKQHVLK